MDELKNKTTEAEVKGGQVVETKKPLQESPADEKGPKIRKGKVDSLTIYEISEGELETIERGSPNSTLLNFAIFLLSIATSFLVTLLTVDLKDKQNLFIVFTIITVVGFIIGLVLFVLWWRTKNDVDEVLKRIKERVKE